MQSNSTILDLIHAVTFEQIGPHNYYITQRPPLHTLIFISELQCNLNMLPLLLLYMSHIQVV